MTEFLITLFGVYLITEFSEFLLIIIRDNFKIPTVKLIDTDLEVGKLSKDGKMIHINNDNYQFVSKSVMSLIVKYHIYTKNYTKLIPIFRFTKNSKLIDNKFKELKNK